MKIKVGDLKIHNGKTIKEVAQYCVTRGDCEGCEYYTKNVCHLVPDYRDLEKNFADIINYEVEAPEASVTSASEDLEQNGYKKVYICSPYRGDTLSNTETAQRFCKWAVLEKKVIPIAPHIYFTQFLDDDASEQREIGVNMGMQCLRECSEIWVLGDTFSEGMTSEIKEATRIGMPIRFFDKTENGFVEDAVMFEFKI